MNDRVYVLHASDVIGGGTIFLIRVAALVQSHIRLTVVAPPLPTVERGLAEVGAGFVGLPARGGVALRWAFVRWLWRERHAIRASRILIVLNGRGSAYFAPIVRWLCGAAPVIISHTELSMRSGDLKEFLYGMAARFARCVVAVSDSVAMQHHQRWPALAVESIPNWIELHPVDTAGSADNLSSMTGKIRAAVVARLAPRKGVEDVVAACRDEDGIELHIYGDGPIRDQLRNMGSQFTWLHFHGHVDDLSRRLPTHSILISGSYSEACSYSLIEGIQAGLLCVLTDIPAHRELLGDDYPDALFFPPGDVAALRQALQAARGFLSRDAGDGARMAVSMALERIATRNSPGAAKPRYLAVFSAIGTGQA